jgi:hypothetical protein
LMAHPADERERLHQPVRRAAVKRVDLGDVMDFDGDVGEQAASRIRIAETVA